MKKKRCSRCELSKPITEFNKKGEGRLQPYCRVCQSVWQKSNYRKKRKEVRSRIERNQEARHAEALLLVNELKASGCTDCGNSYPPVAMDLDHVVGKKVLEVSRMIRRGYSMETIRKELAKCEVVCAVCHRLRTSRRSGIG